MELGTIVFYQDYEDFEGILNHMKIQSHALGIDDKTFKDHYGYDRQSVFQILYQSNNMWGFVCKTIARKDGSTGYRIINAKNKVGQINESDIYFSLTMDDFTYTHWAEMEDMKEIKTSPQGTPIMKKPSDSSMRRAKSVKKIFGLGQNMLYQIVSVEEGGLQYPASNPFNSQWKEYDPFTPTADAYKGYYNKSMPNAYKTQSWNPSTWFNKDTTLHAVPFLRDNIKPTRFSVVKEIEGAANNLRMFVNFPQGLPISFA